MRIADNMNYNQVVQSLNQNRNEASNLQGQAASQKRITKPSDDPAGTTKVLSARTELTGNTQYQKSLQQARSFMDFSEQSLMEMSDVLLRIKELALGQANMAGANAQTRRTVGTEVEQLYNQALQVANRKLGDRFLFGGFKTTEPPFTHSGGYKGDDGEVMIEINRDAYIPMNMPGSKVFHGKGFAVRTLLDSTDGIPHTAEDIESLQEQVEEDKDEMGRPTRPQSGSGPSAPPPVENRGPASVENKTDRYRDQNDGENVFSVMRAVHHGLTTNDVKALQSTIERVDTALNQIVMARSQIGSRVVTLNNTLDSLTRGQVDAKTLVSSVEDVNAFELFSDMSKNENTLKATLESSSRLLKSSLLDFIK